MQANKYKDLGFVPDPAQPGAPDYSGLGFVPDPEQHTTWLHRLATSAMQYTLGAQAGTVEPFRQMGNIINRELIRRGLNVGLIPQEKFGKGTAYEAGKSLGGALAMVGGAALGGVAGLSPEISNILATTGYGGLMEPGARGVGALKGAAAGLLGEQLGATLPAATAVRQTMGNITKFIRPKTVVSDIMNTISPSNLKNRISSGNALYSNIFDNYGSMPLYHGALSDIIPLGQELSERYKDLSPEEKKVAFSPKTKKLDKTFERNPTIKNAHILQSDMGQRVSELEDKKSREAGLGAADNAQLQSYNYSRSLLKNDINDSLTALNPDSAVQYKNATHNWATNVEPYKSAAIIAKKIPGKITPEKFLNAYEKFLNKKIPVTAEDPEIAASFILPSDIRNKLNFLSNAIKNRNLLQTGVGAGLGYMAGFGHLPGEILSGVGGGLLSGRIARALSERFGGVDLRRPILSAERHTAMARSPYFRRILSKSILANLVRGQ